MFAICSTVRVDSPSLSLCVFICYTSNIKRRCATGGLGVVAYVESNSRTFDGFANFGEFLPPTQTLTHTLCSRRTRVHTFVFPFTQRGRWDDHQFRMLEAFRTSLSLYMEYEPHTHSHTELSRRRGWKHEHMHCVREYLLYSYIKHQNTNRMYTLYIYYTRSCIFSHSANDVYLFVSKVEFVYRVLRVSRISLAKHIANTKKELVACGICILVMFLSPLSLPPSTMFGVYVCFFVLMLRSISRMLYEVYTHTCVLMLSPGKLFECFNM